MKILLIVPLIGIVLAAPVADEEKTLRPIVKRAMETIMFGNQQNSAKQVKKSDPSVPLHSELPDVKAPVLPDVGGVVEASKPKDIPESKIVKDKPENELETVGATKTTDKQNESSKDDSQVIPPDDAAAIKELEKSINDDKQSTDNNEYPMDSSYENPYDIYQLYKQYKTMLSAYPYNNNYYDNFDSLSRRRRAIKKQRNMGKTKKPKEEGQAIKRAHRTKRDLRYPDESELVDPYYYPEMPYSESDAYGGYENPYEQEAFAQNQVEPIGELLGENGEYEFPYSPSQYEDPIWYGYKPYGYETDDEEYVPVKRQMLSFVPGNRKRSSFFYPVNEEPQTHFGAFVPEKRDYFETYGSLVRAARLLAARQEEREAALQGYPEWY